MVNEDNGLVGDCAMGLLDMTRKASKELRSTCGLHWHLQFDLDVVLLLCE